MPDARTDGAYDDVPMPPLGTRMDADTDPRAIEAWRAWLSALARDAQAALAAAIAYRSLEPADRESWLVALEQDLAHLAVPPIAAYAPLLAVELDTERRRRILDRLGSSEPKCMDAERIALWGQGPGGVRVAAIISPLYLDFVQVLACGYRKKHGFLWVRHDPITCFAQAPKCGESLDGTKLEAVPLSGLVDELAYAVLAQRKAGQVLPEALTAHADLFHAQSSFHVPPPVTSPS